MSLADLSDDEVIALYERRLEEQQAQRQLEAGDELDDDGFYPGEFNAGERARPIIRGHAPAIRRRDRPTMAFRNNMERPLPIRRQFDGLFPIMTTAPALQHVAAVEEPPSPPPSELHALLAAQNWNDAIERCRTHPDEVSSKIRDDRGYTALHSLLAYNRTTDGNELIPIVTAIMKAAEEIDFQAEFPLGRITYDDVYHMKQFYKEVEAIKSDVAFIVSTTEQIMSSMKGKGNDEAGTTVSASQASQINYRVENCRKKLEFLQEENVQIKKELSEEKEEKKKSNTDDLCIREDFVAKLQCQFDDEMKRYLQAKGDAELKMPSSTDGKTGGSLRLLLDQHNGAKWSPLHLLCVNGGVMEGKVPIFRALLQGYHCASHQVLSLLDRQNRNVLHHIVEISVPTDDTFRAVHYIVGREYSTLFQKDDRGKTPLDYVYSRHSTNVNYGSMSRTDERYEKNDLLLKVLIGYLNRGENPFDGVEDADDQLLSNDDIVPPNLFHSICQLPVGVCPQGIFSALFKGSNEEKFVDENGNTSLHILLANESYTEESNTSQHQSYRNSNDRTSILSRREFRYVLASNRDAVSVQNRSGYLPLRVAMDTRWNVEVLSDLIMMNPQAVLLDKKLEEVPKLMPYVLSLVALSSVTLHPEAEPKIVDHVVRPLDTMFELIRARPAIVSFESLEADGASEPAVANADEGKTLDCEGKKTRKKKLNPFRLQKWFK